MLIERTENVIGVHDAENTPIQQISAILSW
jgi:hypothetical protein